MSKLRDILENGMKEEDWSKDQGLEPITSVHDTQWRREVSIFMGFNAAMQRFVKEGILTAQDVPHFLQHAQDYMSKLYAGEHVRVVPDTPNMKFSSGEPIVSQTFVVDSKLGEHFKDMINFMIEEGRVPAMANIDTPEELETLKTQKGVKIVTVNSQEELNKFLNELKATGDDVQVEYTNIEERDQNVTDDLSAEQKSRLLNPGKQSLN